MANLANVHVAILICDGVEEAEIRQPLQALQGAGALVDIVCEHSGEVKLFKHLAPAGSIRATMTFDDVAPRDYDALLLPGGAMNSDALRVVPKVQEFIRTFVSEHKPIAAICHAPWALASVGVLKDRHVTSYFTIQDDLRNAGAQWTDEAVVEDDGILTSRMPDDIPRFNERMLTLFERAKSRAPAGS
jgi:protease I